jgi:hypothetical protein
MAVTTIGSLTLRYLYLRENRLRDAAAAQIPPVASGREAEEADSKSAVPDMDVVEYVDLTDKQRVEFRYSM